MADWRVSEPPAAARRRSDRLREVVENGRELLIAERADHVGR
jgi:hypothetical protein